MDRVDQFQRDLLKVLLQVPAFDGGQDYHELARLAGIELGILQEIDLSGAPRISLHRLLNGVMLASPPVEGDDAVAQLMRFAAASVGAPRDEELHGLMVRWHDLNAMA